ncbi:MAG: aminotransferase class I/II-fold pyridoxal phosphate-dependent enzyme [Chloroflexi bacterium]|nr:aminotransferase class I/II-fold pyridoxal phosphate-dependent enzyme [Chloroflexota bacterium]
MHLPDFRLERFFARWEFAVRHTLASSDLEPWRLDDLLALADDDGRARWANQTLGYTESPGHPALRVEIARLYKTVTPEEILTFAGAEEAIFVALNVLLGPGDHAIVTWPGYQSLATLAEATGATVTRWPLVEEDGWALDLTALRRALRPNTRVIIVNVPHNPTGALPDPATWAALVALARDAGAILFSDEVYRGLEQSGVEQLAAAVDCSPGAVSLGVMSKAFGLAGLRIGWLASHDAALLARAASYKDYLSICNSGPSEILAIIALRARTAVLTRGLGLIEANLQQLDRFFADWADVMTWVRPQAVTVQSRPGEVGWATWTSTTPAATT